MKLPRRKFLRLAGSATMLPAVPRFARVQGYQSRPVRILVGFAAGGASDIVARLLAQQLSERLGQTFIVENRTGADTNIATEAAVRATPDGYTLLLVTHTNAINAMLYASQRFDFMRDIAPVARIGRVAEVMLVHPSVPAMTGNGSLTHVAGALFDMLTGTDTDHIPYRGEAPGVTGLLAGEVQLMFPSLAVSMAHINAGTLRPLGVTTATGVDALPGVPPVAQSVPGFEGTAWQRHRRAQERSRRDRR